MEQRNKDKSAPRSFVFWQGSGLRAYPYSLYVICHHYLTYKQNTMKRETNCNVTKENHCHWKGSIEVDTTQKAEPRGG